MSELRHYLEKQESWSSLTFGYGTRTRGITSHIRKELLEIEAAPHDLTEWIDVMILAMDGYWRAGGRPQDLMAGLAAKQEKNFARKWPLPKSEDEATEHIREPEEGAAIQAKNPVPPQEPLRIRVNAGLLKHCLRCGHYKKLNDDGVCGDCLAYDARLKKFMGVA